MYEEFVSGTQKYEKESTFKRNINASRNKKIKPSFLIKTGQRGILGQTEGTNRPRCKIGRTVIPAITKNNFRFHKFCQLNQKLHISDFPLFNF